MTLGQKLKQTRLARGMTQSQVVGDRITRNMLSQIENDLASPSVGTLEYLASVLNVRLSWLLADEQEDMIDRYLERGDMFVLEDGGVLGECVVTREGLSLIHI